MTHADAAVLRAVAAVVEVRARTHPHLMALADRLRVLADQLTPDQEEHHDD